MVLRSIFVLLVVIPLFVPVWSSKNSSKNKKWTPKNNNTGNPRFVCEDIQHRQVNGYFSALDTATPEIRERNIYLYKDITFKAPVLILGWVAQGKNGTLNGTLITKRGIIIEYAAHYLEDDGSFTRIYNTDKKSKSKKFFVNEGNLAIPYLKTEVKLENPVKTTVLRIFPQLWDGVPYLYLDIAYCHISVEHENGKSSDINNKVVPGNKKKKINMKHKTKKVKSKLDQNGEVDKNEGDDDEIPEDSTLYQEDEDDSHANKQNDTGDEVPKAHKGVHEHRKKTKSKTKKKLKPKSKQVKSHYFAKYDMNDTGFREEEPPPATTGKTRNKMNRNKLKLISQKHRNVYGKHKKKQNRPTPEERKKVIKGRIRGEMERQKFRAKIRKLMRLRGRMRKLKEKVDKKLKLKLKNEKNQGGNNKTNKHQVKNGSSVEQDIDGPISNLASRLKTKLTDMAKSELLNKEVNKELKCGKKSAWRYSGRSPPLDAFSSFRKSSHAWRSIYDLDVKPFQFLPVKKGQNGSNYLQIKFEHPVKIYGLKILGGSDEDRWGFITKFVLFYKSPGGKWKYYTDDAGKRRNFYIGEKKMTDVFTPSVFHLPLPIKASHVRIYPKKWNGKPLISIDFKTCDLVPEKLLNQKTCSIPMLKKNEHGTKIQFKPMKSRRRRLLRTKLRSHTIALSETTTTKVTAFKITPPNTDDEDGKRAIVTEIAVQYQTKDGKWKPIIGKGSKQTYFSLDQGAYGNLKPTRFNLQKPVVTKALRIIPENWTGTLPSLYINVFGCNVS